MKGLRTLVFFPILSVVASDYSIVDTVIGQDFYNFFGWKAIPDPTNGRVNYVDQPTSIRQNLTYATGDTFILGADHQTVLSPSGPGRNSVRIQSYTTYSQHVAVFDMRHMPEGCGTWPAVWEVDLSNWPYDGEVDIVEGVNNVSPNFSSLHTSNGCTMPTSRAQTGTSTSNDCSVYDTNNGGCRVGYPTPLSFGPTFNDNGGGWYAIERTSTYFRIWFWSRYDGTVPADVLNGVPNINTNNWGTPVAFFPDDDCNFASHFTDHSIIINLTFCGDWAGSAYSLSGCPSTCVDFVNNNPSAFTNAYFDFASIRIYQ